MNSEDRKLASLRLNACESASFRASAQDWNSGTAVISTKNSFQKSRLAGEYGLGSQMGWSRNAARTGKVPTTLPPSDPIHRDNFCQSEKFPAPQLSSLCAAYKGMNAPHCRCGSA